MQMKKKQSKKAGSGAVESKLESKQADPDHKSDTCTRGGGGTRARTGVGFTTLIEPQKKCDKGDCISEVELARRIGIARQALVNYRNKELTKGKDWILDDRAVLLRLTAVNKFLRHLNLNYNDIPKDETPILLQVKKHYRNVKLLGCVDPDGVVDGLQMVWVRNSAMFNINQLIPVCMRGNQLQLACRQPKTKGKII